MSSKVKVDRELNFAHDLMQPILDIINASDTISSVHVCRGNWTQNDAALLSGSYDKLSRFFDSLDVQVLALEFSTPRAGGIKSLFKNNSLEDKITLGLGVINPRNQVIETKESIVQAVQTVLDYLPPERIWLNPDCGFATFSSCPLNSYPIIEQKIQQLCAAANALREKYC